MDSGPHSIVPRVEKIRLYSPRQIGLSSFLVGPVAAVYFLRKNFDALGKNPEARKTLFYGGFLLMLFLLCVPFLPTTFPHYILPPAYALAAEQFAIKYQIRKEDIAASPIYQFQSNWRVTGLSIGCFFVFIVAASLWIAFVFQLEGKIHLEQLWR